MTLTHANLTELLDYEPKTGLFIWKFTRTNRIKIGSVAGSITEFGYRSIMICRRPYLAHRLAWFYMTGEWPKDQIDHINGDKDDNRYENLREATRSQNMRNRDKTKRNTSGFKGVHFHSRSSRWRVQIGIGGKLKYVGQFRTIEEAHRAYKEAAAAFHGEFARTN